MSTVGVRLTATRALAESDGGSKPKCGVKLCVGWNPPASVHATPADASNPALAPALSSAWASATASRYTLSVEVRTTGTGPTKPLTLGPLSWSSVTWGSEQDPEAAMAAFSDAFRLAFAVTLALVNPSVSVQLPSNTRPAVNVTSCSIDAPALPTHSTRARCAARGRGVCTVSATR